MIHSGRRTWPRATIPGRPTPPPEGWCSGGGSPARVRRSIGSAERLGREHEVHHQELEVGPVAERVEGRFGPVSVGVAVAHRDCLGQQGHGRLRFGGRVGGRDARAVASGQAGQRGMAAGGLEPFLARPRRQVRRRAPAPGGRRPRRRPGRRSRGGPGRGAGGWRPGRCGNSVFLGSSWTSDSRMAIARS